MLQGYDNFSIEVNVFSDSICSFTVHSITVHLGSSLQHLRHVLVREIIKNVLKKDNKKMTLIFFSYKLQMF